ncbi:alpha/beta hydrolase [Myroides sp. LJL119]
MFSVIGRAQEVKPISIGSKYSLYANELQEQREVEIYLPLGYDTKLENSSYPVVYLLDSESNFHYLTGIIANLSKGPYPKIPPMIVVGIINTDRSRDLTPSTPLNMSVQEKARISGETGGNAKFFAFIEQDLIPFVESNFSTNGYNILIGHSFGGITSLNYLLKNNDTFKSFVVHDPSIWWDGEYILQQFKATMAENYHGKKLFLSQVGALQNKGHLQAHYKAIKEFDSLIQKEDNLGLEYIYKQYPEEDHGSIVLKANIDALKYLFQGFDINFKQVEQNPDLIKDSYESFSIKMNHRFVPDANYLKLVIDFFKRSGKQKQAQDILDYSETIYPDFIKAYQY